MWVEYAGYAVFFALLLYLPGLIVTRTAGIRGPVAAAATPLLSATMLAVAAFAAPRIGLSWSLLPVGIVWLFGLGVALGIRVLKPPTAVTPWSGQKRWFVFACVIAMAFQVVYFSTAILSPQHFAQEWDNVAHLNIVDLFVQRENADFLSANITTYGSTAGFYPALWHAIVSVGVLTFGGSIIPAANALNLVITTCLWGLGIGLLTGQMTRNWNLAALGTLFAYSFSQMPNLFMYFGVLYPNELGYVLIPSLLVLVLEAVFGINTSIKPFAMVAAVFAMPGIAIAHPNTIFSLLFFLVPIFLVYSHIKIVRKRPQMPRKTVLAVLTLLLVFITVVIDRAISLVPSLQSMRTQPAWWVAEGAWYQGLARVLTMTMGRRVVESGPIAMLLGLLVLVGLYVVWKNRELRWIPLSFIALGSFYIIAFSAPSSVRGYLVGLWYTDINRIQALFPIVAVPALAYAVNWGVQVLITRRRPRVSAETILAVAALLIAVTSWCLPPITGTYSDIRNSHAYDTGNPQHQGLLSLEEKTVLERMTRYAKPGEVAIGNPWDGSAFTTIISGVEFPFKHVGPVKDDEAHYVTAHLNQAKEDPRVCELIKKRNFTYVVDFGQHYLWDEGPNDRHALYFGLSALERYGLAEVIDKEGTAKILRITACE